MLRRLGGKRAISVVPSFSTREVETSRQAKGEEASKVVWQHNIVFMIFSLNHKTDNFADHFGKRLQQNCREILLMKLLRLENHILKFFAVVVASLLLPGLALAGADKGKGNDGQNNGNQFGKTKNGDPSVSSVPEANTGIVLIPFVGAVLLVSSLQLLRLRAQKSGSLS